MKKIIGILSLMLLVSACSSSGGKGYYRGHRDSSFVCNQGSDGKSSCYRTPAYFDPADLHTTYPVDYEDMAMP